MVIVFVVIFVVVVAVIVRALVKSAPNLSVDDDDLQVRAPSVQRGAPAQPKRDDLVVAHGLIIRSSPQSKSVRKGNRRYERHAMTIEVEIPGRDPYECSGKFLVPRGLEATPGTALELSVHPSNRQQVVVLGPAGFTGPWLNWGPPNRY